jgi:HK97 family phage portal protein
MLERLFERSLQVPPWGYLTDSDHFGLWPGDPGYGTGGPANPLHLSVVLGCVRLISDSISTLPVDVYRKVGDEKIPVTPPDWLVEPVVGLDFIAWCGQVLSSLLLNGNAYLLIGRGATGSIVELRPLDPSNVTIQGGRYFVNGRAAEILHIRGLMLAGSNEGLSPVGLARETFGLGLAALHYGKDFFDRGVGDMPGVLEYQKPLIPEKMKEVARSWQRTRQRGGRGLPGVVDDGGTYKPIAMSNEDAQFLATRNYTAAEIAGQIFLLDPSDLGISLEGSSKIEYGNIEQRNARRVQVTLLPWMVRVEAAISRLLAAPRYMKFNVDGLLRGDMKTQFESWAIGVEHQFLVPNEPRAWMDLKPLPGGDQVKTAPAPNPIGGADVAA